MRLLITRPIKDSEPLAAILAERGIETIIQPLMTIADVEGPAIDLDGVQALLITSANGIRTFAKKTPEREVAVFAVGDASARTARGLGFGNVKSASGDVDALAALVQAELDSGAGALLHIAGTHVAGDLSGLLTGTGFEVKRQVLYEGKAAESLSPQTIEAMQANSIDGVLLFSPRTASLFAELVAGAGLTCAGLKAYCLSPAVAEKVRALPWVDIVIAPEPTGDALLGVIVKGDEEGG
ncbi:MAG: uroporphyrinogen-III synthase [Rhodospirillales bacterium]|nr:uroporphyrinogen-III synthase [Rhodospirillales bacterium]